MKRHKLLLAFGIWILNVVFAHAGNTCAPSHLDVRSYNSSVRFAVEIADTIESRAIGLMNRSDLGRFAGMLFVYPDARAVSFWMRNTLIPLDMIFIDSAGVVKNIHENATPLSEDTIYGGEEIQFVFEINGGMARALGITVGSEVRHPSISGDNVIWQCE